MSERDRARGEWVSEREREREKGEWDDDVMLYDCNLVWFDETCAFMIILIFVYNVYNGPFCETIVKLKNAIHLK